MDWGHQAASSEFAVHVSAPAPASGDIGAPACGRPVTIQVNGKMAGNGSRGVADGARSDGSYVYLHHLPGGSYGIVARPPGRPAGPPAQALSVTAQVGAPATASQPGTVTVTGQAPGS